MALQMRTAFEILHRRARSSKSGSSLSLRLGTCIFYVRPCK